MKMSIRNTSLKQILTIVLGLPLAFLLSHCARDFDNPPRVKSVEVNTVASGLNKPFALAIVPDEAAAAKAGQSLHHEDLLVANFGDNTIRQIDESVSPSLVRLFADTSDTAFLKQPSGIALETASGRGDVYISNFLDEDGVTTGGAITVFNKDGSLKGVINDALFKGARGIVYDVNHSIPTQAIFFVSSLGNASILKIVVDLAIPAGPPVAVVSLYADLKPLGLPGKNPTQLAISPISPFKLYAANTGLQPPDEPSGSTITVIPTTGASAIPVPTAEIALIDSGEVGGPLPLGFDAEGHLFTSDHEHGTLVMIDPLTGRRLASVETGEANIYGIAVGAAGVYLTAVKGGRIIEVEKSLLTNTEEEGGHDHG